MLSCFLALSLSFPDLKEDKLFPRSVLLQNIIEQLLGPKKGFGHQECWVHYLSYLGFCASEREVCDAVSIVGKNGFGQSPKKKKDKEGVFEV